METFQSNFYRIEVKSWHYRIVDMKTNEHTDWGDTLWIFEMLKDMRYSDLRVFDSTCKNHFN